MRQYRDVDRKMNSPWCDSTWRCKEGYGQLNKLLTEIYSILDKADGIELDKEDY